MQYSCLIIGLGQIGMSYDLNSPKNEIFTHSKAFSVHLSFEIVGAVDPSAAQRSTFEKLFRKPAFSDIPSAIKGLKFDVVVISSPTAFHSMHVRIVLSLSKPLAILCEKPLAYDLAEAKEIVQSCDSCGVMLYVNYMRRSDPGAIEVKKRIMTGSIANPIKGTVWYSKGFLHNGSHLFNLIQFWLGSYQRHSIISKGRLWNNIDPEPDVYVEFEHGHIVFLAAWEEYYSHYTVELVSQTGRLHYDRGGELIQWQSTIIDPHFIGYTILNPNPEIIQNGMYQYQYHVADQLARALEGKEASLCSGHEAFDTIKTMHEIID
ncbi:MAG: Gfo/Idh/MocA family oxidoreductase [Bacteroidetes bacterium]|nr:Gfo/Idh/MocA family oxidoreductase [Bacteroidota bacterium]